MSKINYKLENEYEKRINKIIDSIEEFGFTIDDPIIEFDSCTFEVKEISNWKFCIDLIDDDKEQYKQDAILWGLWKPGIMKFNINEAFYKIKFIIDDFGKENNRYYFEGPEETRDLFKLILKYPWYTRYYSLSSDNGKMWHSYLWYRKQCKDFLNAQKYFQIKDFIINTKIKLLLKKYKNRNYINNYILEKNKVENFCWVTLPTYNLQIYFSQNNINVNYVLSKLNRYFNYNITLIEDNDKEVL